MKKGLLKILIGLLMICVGICVGIRNEMNIAKYGKVWVVREDLTSCLTEKEIESLSDNAMKYLASKMGNTRLDPCYLDNLKIISRDLIEENKTFKKED